MKIERRQRGDIKMINKMEIPTTKQKLTERIRGDDVYSASHLKRDNLGRYLTIEYARDLNVSVPLRGSL